MIRRRRSRVVARAHAKVNLDLRVLGMRADGYHELRTVFQTIELHDTLVCATRPGPFTLKCRTPGVPLDESNLVWKAAAGAVDCARTRGRRRATRRCTIEKEIPIAGRARRRQRRRGGRAAGAGAALGRRADHAAAGSRRRPSAPTCRSSCPAAPRSGSDAAKKSIRSSICRRTGSSSSGRRSACRPPRPTPGTTRTGPPGCGRTRELQMLPVPWPTRAAQMINDLEPPVVRRHPEIGDAQGSAARGGRRWRRRCRAAARPFSACSAAGLPRRVPLSRCRKAGARRCSRERLAAPSTSGGAPTRCH